MPVNDKQLAFELQAYENMLIGAYAQAIGEANCPEVRQVLQQILSRCIQNSAELGQFISAQGWSMPRYAPLADIAAAAEAAQQTGQNLKHTITAWQAAQQTAQQDYAAISQSDINR